ncbi:Alpha/beta hydrolase domain-containing protein 17C [Camellia lanceoleosa]|uniref:Alpha/beta hydrolase domain-containing protein 17C n=1 Tax=Camellia lanceoleosa TaxID=1840588 RepID=A0ACC0I9T9_9ERIC|nr:Alpha/beta hydrolase domain-containing protein 17C [Camellia lanceoleosa]
MASWVAAKIAFHPPAPPRYDIISDGRTLKLRVRDVPEERGEVLRLRTKTGNYIVCVYVRGRQLATSPAAAAAALTVLYSHGNATDIGEMFSFITDLSDQLGVNVMAYDYSGYGRSTGEASEGETYADIEAAYKCLRETYGVKEENIVLYGQSLGSGPTVDLAIRVPRLRAVILHSGLLSGFRAFFGSLYFLNRSLYFDIYQNVDKIPFVNCRVLVIHGTSDEVVSFFHGEELYRLCKFKYEPLWVKGGKHNDLVFNFSNLFWTHLKKFISAIKS